ncbi:MAG: ABC transporter ATP-binding protein [Clostridiales bacterium]|nr:ABC transporter ATP-binding protein [Clostridiales bacterium]
MSVLVAENLTKTYGEINAANCTNALNGVSLNVEEGDFIAIMGPSGSGKSTLVSILSGILTPSSGTVTIADQRIDTMDKFEMSLFRRQKLGFVFQEFNLLDHLTLRENVMLPMVLDKQDQKHMEEKAASVMKMFGIYEMKDKYPYEVSGGQQQRTAVARALVNQPKIIFADEPTGNLDSKSSNAVMNCLKTMNEEQKATILMVTHDVFAASFCKQVIFIKDGRINMDISSHGSRQEFFDQILDCQAIVGGENRDI